MFLLLIIVQQSRILSYPLKLILSLISVFMSCQYFCGALQCLVHCIGMAAKPHMWSIWHTSSIQLPHISSCSPCVLRHYTWCNPFHSLVMVVLIMLYILKWPCEIYGDLFPTFTMKNYSAWITDQNTVVLMYTYVFVYDIQFLKYLTWFYQYWLNMFIFSVW
jgi:hypothetical protein